MTNYPDQIDNTISLPPVIDNFTPVTGSVFNNLRAAIIAVEEALGINPNGFSSTVANRLNMIESSISNLQFIQLDGDLGNTTTTPFVIGIWGRPISSAPPSVGNVLTWNGIVWEPSSTPDVTTVIMANGTISQFQLVKYSVLGGNIAAAACSTTDTIGFVLAPSLDAATSGQNIRIALRGTQATVLNDGTGPLQVGQTVTISSTQPGCVVRTTAPAITGTLGYVVSNCNATLNAPVNIIFQPVIGSNGW
jgi:hypothetical protein